MAKPKKIWDNYQEVAEVQKSNRIKFVVAIACREGIRYLNIREFYLRQRDNVWRPGRDGITVPLSVPLGFDEATGTITSITPCTALIASMTEAIPMLEAMAISDPAHAVYAEPKEDK